MRKHDRSPVAHGRGPRRRRAVCPSHFPVRISLESCRLYTYRRLFIRKRNSTVRVFLFYAIWYGAGRAFIEGLRTDSLYLGPIRISQLVSAVICAAGIILMVIGCMRAPRAHLPAVVKTAAKAGESAEKENSKAILRKTTRRLKRSLRRIRKVRQTDPKMQKNPQKRIRQNQRKRTMAKIIDGRELPPKHGRASERIRSIYCENRDHSPVLPVIIVGDNPASQVCMCGIKRGVRGSGHELVGIQKCPRAHP